VVGTVGESGSAIGIWLRKSVVSQMPGILESPLGKGDSAVVLCRSGFYAISPLGYKKVTGDW